MPNAPAVPNPSEIAHFVRIRTKPYPLTTGSVGVIPTAVTDFDTATGVDAYGNVIADGFDPATLTGTLPNFVKGTLGGPTYAEINDTAQDSPDYAEEMIPGRLQPPKVSLTFKGNRWTAACLILLLPPNPRVAPSMGRRMWEGVTAGGVRYRYLGWLNLTNFVDIGEGEKVPTEAEIVTSGKPVILVPAAPALG